MDCKLEILTAVNIGSGEVLSQFSDYIYDNGFVYCLDHDLLLWELTKKSNGEEMIDEFVMVVQNQAKGNLKDRYKLKSFLEEAGLDYKKCALRIIPVSDEVKEQIQLHIKSGSQPYIPGSSLKGAIRTALIAHLFSPDDEDLLLHNLKETKNKNKYIGQNYFGTYGDDILKYLLVSDTMPFQKNDLGIAKFYKLNLESGKTDIPLVKEVISRGSISTFTLKTKAKKGEVKNELAFLYEGKEDSLFGVINEYTRKNIVIELQQLKKSRKDEKREIEEFYTNLLQFVVYADSSKEAYLRIGSGKTYYDSTIGQKLSENVLQQVIRKNFIKADYKFFPKTRTVIMEGNTKKVPGWIKISKL